MPTNADAQSTTVTSAAARARPSRGRFTSGGGSSERSFCVISGTWLPIQTSGLAPQNPPTAFAAASDEARPILTGVLARFEGDQLTLAAADNYRIAVKTITILDPVEETSVVIPARALHELSRVLADVDDPVSIVLAHARNQVLFHLEGIDLVSRLIDGQYPNYQSVLPASYSTRAIIDREELLRAVRPAALIAHESANIVKLGVGLEGDAGITVSANAVVRSEQPWIRLLIPMQNSSAFGIRVEGAVPEPQRLIEATPGR
jgi:hypothetical protein